MAYRIQIRRDTAANWTSANPTLAAGEFAMETDTRYLKLGDGSTAWADLGYYDGEVKSQLADVANRVEALEASRWRYGIKIDKNNSDPDARVEYLYDAVGMTPAYMDFTGGTFNYGSWESFAKWVNKPVMLKYDGTVDYDLDRDDHTKKTDGTASDVANTAYEGNAMSQFRLLWIKQYEDATHEYIIFSNVQYDGDYKAYAHTDKDGVVRDYMYRAMFDGSYTDPRLRSLATGSVMASQTGQTEITRAEANGKGWMTSYKSQRDFITYLLWMMAKSTNTQAAYGEGNSSSGAYINPGSMTSAGQFSGSSTTDAGVKVFYIEHFWGNYWERMAGQIMDLDGQVYTKMTPPYTQPALPGENALPSGYTATGVTPSGGSGGYVTQVTLDPETGFVQSVTGGASNQYYADGMWYTIGTTVKWALVGGIRFSAALCGASTVSLNHPLSYATSYFGAALAFLENAS